jgi:predicted acetyltransferase
VQIRTLDPADLDALEDLKIRAFAVRPRTGWRDTATRAVGEDRLIGVYDGSRLAASACYHPCEQWWHGRAVPMGGVASVCVAPEDRGRGIGRRLAAAIVERMDGRPLSALFPATSPVYRSVGYEHAGSQHWVQVRPEALRTLPTGSVRVRRAEPDDAERVVTLLRRLHAESRDCGPIDHGEDFFRDLLGDESVYSYLADDGFLSYHWWTGGLSDWRTGGARLVVDRCVAGSEETARALWSVVGTGSSIADQVHACVAPHDPLFWLLRDRSTEDVHRESWMLRVLDAPEAVAVRGFPEGVSAEVSLAVTDTTLPGNDGAWRLSVADGRGRLEKAVSGDDLPRLSARGLAALYAGLPMATLRRAGLAEGGGRTDPLLDAAFAATPFMLDHF